MQTKRVFMTGASGVMGYASFKEIYQHRPDIDLVLLLRDSKKNRTMFKNFEHDSRVKIVWGDLLDYKSVKEGVDGCDYVLHIGGLVSPKADPLPIETTLTNVGAAENIVRAVKEQKDPDSIKVVYIGTVAQTGERNDPIHWGRCGDPIKIAIYDHYGASKAKAERIFAESGLKHWVSLRQTGILSPNIFNNIDPIMFHVVLRGVLEWATVEDSATLMSNICRDDVPESFWRKFYNISSGPSYRMTNFEFEDKLLYCIGMGHNATKKLFNPNWFITRNFHGQWYLDSDELENILHFRHNIPVDEYFETMKNGAPMYTKVAWMGSNWIGKMAMKFIAHDKRFGTLSWIKNKDTSRMNAFFGSYEDWEKLPSTWDKADVSRPSNNAIVLDHGYDETKPVEQLTIEDMKKAAHFRGGECLSNHIDKCDGFYKPLHWKCAFGHEFDMTPCTVLKGGHWCPECDPVPWQYDKIAKVNPFFAQVWYPIHRVDENNTYDMSIYKDYDEFKNIPDKDHIETLPIPVEKKADAQNVFIVLFAVFALLSVAYIVLSSLL